MLIVLCNDGGEKEAQRELFMKIECEKCGFRYSVPDEKLQGTAKRFQVKCRNCEHLIEFAGHGEDEVIEGEADERTVLEPMSMAALEDNVDPSLGQMAPASEDAMDTQVSVIPENILAQIPEEDWYVVLDGAQVGPISRGTLLRHISNGEADGSAYVWREGFAEWLVMDQVAGLRDVIAAGGTWASDTEDSEDGLPTLDDLKKTQLVSSDVLEAASAHVAAARAEREAEEEVSAEANMDSIFGDEATEESSGGFFDAPETESSKEAEDLLYQRRDTSVLFSMEDLSGGSKSAPGIGEGLGERTQESGLIDIRAVARNRVTTTEETAAQDLFSDLEGGMETKVMTSAMDTRMRQGTAPLLRVKKKSSAWPLVAGVGIGSLIAAVAFVVVIGNPFSASDEKTPTKSQAGADKGSVSESNSPTGVPVNESSASESTEASTAPVETPEVAAAPAPTEDGTEAAPGTPAEATTGETGEGVDGVAEAAASTDMAEPASAEAVAGTVVEANEAPVAPAAETPPAVAKVSKASSATPKKETKKTKKEKKKEKKKKTKAPAAAKAKSVKEVAPTPEPPKPKKEVVSSSTNERRSDATALLASLKSDGGGSGKSPKETSPAKTSTAPKTLSSSAIRKVIRKYQKKVKNCYLKAGTDSQDKVVVTAKMVVSGSGGVSSVSLTGNAPANAKSCIQGVLKSVKFPSFGGDSQTVRIPFRLK